MVNDGNGYGAVDLVVLATQRNVPREDKMSRTKQTLDEAEDKNARIASETVW